MRDGQGKGRRCKRMVEPSGGRGRNGSARGTGLDEIVKGAEQQAEFALLDRFGLVAHVDFVHMREQGHLGNKQQQANADNARRRQKSIDRLPLLPHRLHLPRAPVAPCRPRIEAPLSARCPNPVKLRQNKSFCAKSQNLHPNALPMAGRFCDYASRRMTGGGGGGGGGGGFVSSRMTDGMLGGACK